MTIMPETSAGSSSAGHTPLQVAFLGGGLNSAVGRAHRVSIEMDQRFRLVSGCFSRDPQKNKEAASSYGIDPGRAHPTLEALIAAEASNIDCIVLLTPQDVHARQVTICLDAGIPVICEKALVESSKEAADIKGRLAEKGGFLAVTYNYTGYPMIRELKQMVENGSLGKLQQIHIEMPQEGFARLGADGGAIVPQEWRLRDHSVPTLSLDLGVHLHMMVRFLSGEAPEEVVAVSSSRGNFAQVIDNVSCIARYSGELDCSIWYSKTAFGYRNGLKLRVFGTGGSAEWVQEFPEYLEVADNSGGKFRVDRTVRTVSIANQNRYQRFKAGHPAGFIEAFANYYYDVADALINYRTTKDSRSSGYVFGVDESYEGLRMLEAISRSSKSRQWEKV